MDERRSRSRRRRDAIEAAAFRRLTALLRHRTDVQNVDLMGVGRLLPQLPVGLDRRGGGRRAEYALSKDTARGSGSTGCPTPTTRRVTRPRRAPAQLAAMAASVAKNRTLDEALADSFPASDPPSASEP